MRRKVLLHGQSSLGICLPSQWAKNNSIEKGDEVDLCEIENKIIISKINSTINKTTQINFEKINFSLQKELINLLYEKGYDEIIVNYSTKDVLKQVYIYLNEQNIGYEIINKESNYFVIKNISSIKEDQLYTLINRISKLLMEYSQKILNMLEHKNSLTITALMHPKSINKLSIYSKKIVVKNNLKNGVYYYNLLKNIEKITHQLDLFYNIMIKDEVVFDKINEIYRQVNNCIVKIYYLFINFTLIKYSQINDYLQNLKKEIEIIKIDNNLILNHIKIILKNLEKTFKNILYLQDM